MFKFRFALQRSFGKCVPLNKTQNLRDSAVESMTFTSLMGKDQHRNSWEPVRGEHRHIPTQFPFSMYRQFMQLMTDINFGKLFSEEHFQRVSTIYLIRQEIEYFGC